MKTGEISYEEWTKELARVEKERPDGMTRQEIQDALGLSQRGVMRLLKQAKEDGRLIAQSAMIENIAGRMGIVPVYKLTTVKRSGR